MRREIRNLLYRIFAFAFVCAIAFSSSAQPYVDVLKINYQSFAPVKSKSDPGIKVKANQMEAGFFLPLERKNKDVILLGGKYSDLEFYYSGRYRLHGVLNSELLVLGYSKQWKNEKWQSALLFLPKFSYEVPGKASDAFQAGGLVMMKYKKKENLSLHAGLYYNTEFFGSFFVPLLGIDWRISPHFILFGDLPSNMNLEYKIGKSLYSGIAFNSYTNTFRTHASSNSSSYILEGDRNFGHDDLKFYLNTYFVKHIALLGEAGYTINHIFQEYDHPDHLEIAPGVYKKTNDGIFFNIGLAYRFRLDH